MLADSPESNQHAHAGRLGRRMRHPQQVSSQSHGLPDRGGTSTPAPTLDSVPLRWLESCLKHVVLLAGMNEDSSGHDRRFCRMSRFCAATLWRLPT
jgi:hypothetical protein